MSGPASAERLRVNVPFEIGVLLGSMIIRVETPSELPGVPTTSPVHESGSGNQDLERAHCKFLNVEYPPVIDRIAKEQFDRAIMGQARLTRQQWRVARRVARGFENKEIAAQMGITPDTVKKHVGDVMLTSKVDNRTRIAMWFVGL